MALLLRRTGVICYTPNMAKPTTTRTPRDAPDRGQAITADGIPLIVHWASPRLPQATTLAHHREYEIHLIKRGAGAYFIRDRYYAFRRNTLLLIPPHVTHRFAPKPGASFEKYTLMFWPSRYGRASSAFRLPTGTPNMLILGDHDAASVEILFRALAYESDRRPPFWLKILTLHLRHLFLLIRRAAQDQDARDPGTEPVTRALVSWCTTEIENRFAEDLTLHALAREAGYSLYHLAHVFKQETGLSVKQYILQRRIADACRILLEQRNLTVDAVAQQVGFSDFALFNRSFKKMTGQPPTQYRNFSHLPRNH